MIRLKEKRGGGASVLTLPELRTRKFLTQKALADLVGVYPAQVSDWERGNFRPNMEHLRKLCEVLEVTPDEIDFPELKKEPARV